MKTILGIKSVLSLKVVLMGVMSMAVAGGLIGAEGNPMGEFANIDGFPVLSRHFVAGELESETILKSADERDLDPDDFGVPEGYKLETMGMK